MQSPHTGFSTAPAKTSICSPTGNAAPFPTAVDEVIAAYRAKGYRVHIDLRLDTFARLHVTDLAHPDQQHRVELVANWRAQPPVHLLRHVDRFDDEDFTDYGLAPSEIAGLRTRVSAWRTALRREIE